MRYTWLHKQVNSWPARVGQPRRIWETDPNEVARRHLGLTHMRPAELQERDSLAFKLVMPT